MTFWLRNGKPALFVMQPYQIFDVAELGAFCAERKLECVISTHPGWHYPGEVLHLEISRAR